MKLAEILTSRTDDIARRWFERVLDTYPPETAKLWKSRRDAFQNPVAHIMDGALKGLVVEVVRWQDADAIAAHITDIVRIRSVQDFPPSKALSFVYLFKGIVRELCEKHGIDDEERRTYESRVDNMALIAMDVYAECKRLIYQMRVDEFKRTYHRVFQAAGVQVPQTGAVLDETSVNDSPRT